MGNKIFSAVTAMLCFCVLLNGMIKFGAINWANLQEACIAFRHRAEKIVDKVQKDRWIGIVVTGKEEGGGQIADYLIKKRIQEDRKQIQRLTEVKGVTNKTLPTIHELYQDGVALAQQYYLTMDIIYDYAYFLMGQKEYNKAMRLALRLEKHYQTEFTTEENKALLYNLLGILQRREMHFEEAEQYYRKAISIWQTTLLQQNTTAEVKERGLANSLCNLGILLCATNRTAEGEEMYSKAFEIRQRLVKARPDNALFSWDLAASYNVMGNLNKKRKRFDEAKIALQKAIEIEKNLTNKYPLMNEYECTLANSYCSLANLYRAMERYEKAELNYYTANWYFSRLAERNAGYKSDQAYGYYCMASNYEDMVFGHKQAIKFYKRAMKLQEEVIKDHSLALWGNPHFINNLSVMAGFVSRYLDTDTEELPVNIQRYVTNETPKGYIRDLADSYERLFTLQWNRVGKRAVEQSGRNAIILYELLSRENPSLCENDLAHVKFLLGMLYAEEKRHVEAKSLLRDSLRRYMQLAEKGDAESYVERLETVKLLLNDEEEYLKEL